MSEPTAWTNHAGDQFYAYENIDHHVNLVIVEVPKGRRMRGDKASMPLDVESARALGSHLRDLADEIERRRRDQRQGWRR